MNSRSIDLVLIFAVSAAWRLCVKADLLNFKELKISGLTQSRRDAETQRTTTGADNNRRG